MFNFEMASNNNPGADTGEDNASMQLARWNWFWQNRVYRGDSTPGSFKYAYQALSNFVQNPVCPATNPTCPSTCTVSTPVTSNWQSLGPSTFPSQVLGLVWK